MAYDFSSPANRYGSGCYKWDTMPAADVIPMWVADMDFRVAKPITDALQARVEHGVFGYTKVKEAYYDSIIAWFKNQHNWSIDREWIMYTTGVVPALSAIIKALTRAEDKVIVLSPVYNCFFSSIRNNKCETCEVPLQIIQDEKNDQIFSYVIDFDALETACKDEKSKLLILCNPHNPAGRVWTKEELLRVNDICMRHNVVVISDEIHCELTMPNYHYTPFASISTATLNNSIVCCSASKSFNIAGLQIANIICNNADIRQAIDRAINENEICDVNPFGVEATIAAYNDCLDWLTQLNSYIYNNYSMLKRLFAAELPELRITRLEATYLVWVDIRSTNFSSDKLTELLLNEGKVLVNSGTMYSADYGEGFIRINIACPEKQMLEGLYRIITTIKSKRNK